MKKVLPYIPLVLFTLILPFVISVVLVLGKQINEEELQLMQFLHDVTRIYGKVLKGITMVVIIMYPILNWVNFKSPWKNNQRQKLISEMILLVLLSILFVFLAIHFFKVHQKSLQMASIITVLMNITCYAFMKLRIIVTENTNLAVALANSEKERINSQLMALRQQVNPHFLFNSLNVLSTLVHEDPDEAESFIHEFGDVYRYVLEINDEPVVTLHEELGFLESYAFLQKIRFKDGLVISKNISANKLSYLIPPLTLQLLIENAIKHNIISSNKPFTIELENQGDFLIIKNSLQPRKTKEKSLGLGLKNLQQKYELISDLKPTNTIENNWFVVRVPLLKPEEKA